MHIRPKHRIEYFLLRTLVRVFRLLPMRLAFGLMWGIAVLGHYGFRFRAAEARRRIREVFGDHYSEREVRRIAWVSWRNLCLNVVELCRAPDMTEEWIHRHLDLRAIESSLAYIRSGKPAIFGTAHIGNYDIIGTALYKLGIPVFFIARRQRNPLTNDFLNRMRGYSGGEVLQNEEGVVREVVKRLRKSQVLCILPDVRHPRKAESLRFLGKTANIAVGAAAFARMADAPIFPSFDRRIGWFDHQIRAYPAIRPNQLAEKKSDILRMIQEYLDIIEQEIRAAPEQYFWYNKRWVLDPFAE